MKIRFLEEKHILRIHEIQVKTHGGDSGLRDGNLLLSAIAQPQQSFGGEYLHKDIFEMAAAYLFHLCQNHPFHDGNKRVGLDACITFLALNGFPFDAIDPKDAYALTMEVANGNLGKDQIAAFLREKYSAR